MVKRAAANGAGLYVTAGEGTQVLDPRGRSRGRQGRRRAGGHGQQSPSAGQKALDVASDFSRKGTLAAIEKGEISRPAPDASTFFVNDKDRAWVNSKISPQPVGVALQPIRLTGAREKVAKKTYIRAPKYPQPWFDKYYAAKQADPTSQERNIRPAHRH